MQFQFSGTIIHHSIHTNTRAHAARITQSNIFTLTTHICDLCLTVLCASRHLGDLCSISPLNCHMCTFLVFFSSLFCSILFHSVHGTYYVMTCTLLVLGFCFYFYYTYNRTLSAYGNRCCERYVIPFYTFYSYWKKFQIVAQ